MHCCLSCRLRYENCVVHPHSVKQRRLRSEARCERLNLASFERVLCMLRGRICKDISIGALLEVKCWKPLLYTKDNQSSARILGRLPLAGHHLCKLRDSSSISASLFLFSFSKG